MKEDGQEDIGSLFSVQSLLQLIRAVGSILGVIAIIIGLVYVTRIFALILGVLNKPESFDTLLDQWIKVVGGEQLDVIIAGTRFHSANLIAIMVLGGGVSILALISMGLILTGAKIVSWTLGDRDAIKKMLASAFGSEKKSSKSAAESHNS